MDNFVLMFSARQISSKIHHHLALQIVFTTHIPFNSVIAGMEYEKIYGFMVKPNITHACTVTEGELNIINIEPYSTTGKFINQMFSQGNDVIVFETKQEFQHHFDLNKTDILNSLHQKINTYSNLPKQDSRMLKVIDYLNQNFHLQNLNPHFLSQMINLSSSRFSVLFKEYTGASLSRYLLWLRLRKAINLSLLEKGLSLTNIAIEAGFYDLPQLNKYMKEMIGVPPQIFKQYSNLIQAY
jgi:AraC-like DNA-binding protein